ncbi:long-chain-fatty-acid--CoA ligase [Thiocystis violacea]|uniref:long-chain-fatty-acid--CoA ligase n=1 Tax=Thiocystis violacea TaxID=13725 RepID=UPI00190595E9|nr:long-chain fatty acid--CoA ligase [Thiocystis violacea]MBK1717804.1 long-chain fatty acid--CoA ligase [Thiocystis violacea]
MDDSQSVDLDIPACFRHMAKRRGDAVCLFHDEGNWTFEALDRASDGLAAALAEAGIAAGDRIALLCGNGPEFVIAYLGILKAGATAVPLNLLLNPREIAFILDDCGARGLVYQQAFATVADSAMEGLDGIGLRIRIGEADESEAVPFADLIEHPGPPPERALGSGAGEGLAVILYTSGTTGHPKGAMLSHANLLANAASVAQALDFTQDDRVLVVLPMFHAFAATVGMLTPLLHGFALVPVARFEPRLVTQAIVRHGATVFLGVPSMCGLLLRLDEEMTALWRGVRIGVSGGAAMPLAIMSAFEARFGVPLLEGDGPTECGPVTCVNPVRGERKPGSVGPPIPNVEMRILNAEGSSVAAGEMGEVCVRGPNVMKGYLNQPEATRESFFGDWFRTGDLGYRDSEGYFYLVDRLKDLIITNGMNVYPRAIEEVLHAHPEVAEVVVVGDPDPRHGEVPVAHLALKPGATVTPAGLRAWCREHLGQHEIPRRFELREALPRNAAGKILKRELRRSGERERGFSSASADTDEGASD